MSLVFIYKVSHYVAQFEINKEKTMACYFKLNVIKFYLCMVSNVDPINQE